MPNWGVVGTFVLSLILACGFLRRRCRGIGPPFGPRARFWASVIVVATAAVSAGLGLLIAAASHQIAAAYVGIIVPSALLLSRLPPQGDRLSSGGSAFVGVLALPFSRLYERMGDDRDRWRDTRLTAASVRPQWIADAVTYYYAQVRRGLRDDRARAELGGRYKSITCSDRNSAADQPGHDPGATAGAPADASPRFPSASTPMTTGRGWPAGWKATR